MDPSATLEADFDLMVILSGVVLEVAIPSRVKCVVPISIENSKISPSSKGIFVGGEVKEGDTIFTIPEPLLRMVGDGQEVMSTTCDNCFAKQSDANKLSACGWCGVLYYCDMKCLETAWGQHHKHECGTLKTIKSTSSADLIFLSTFRCMIRILCLRSTDLIPFSEWARFKSFELSADLRTKYPDTAEQTDIMATVVKGQVSTSLEEREIANIFYAMYHTMLGMGVPLFKIQVLKSGSGSKVKGGWCLDFVTSLIRQSRSPNVVWVFEGTKLGIKASKGIEAGSEISFLG